MDLKALSTPLSVSQIDFRIQSINRGGYATILAYKDARVDINRLNTSVGVGKWQRKHELINSNLFCSVGIWNKEISQWCWVQDVGVESQAAKEKGEASDSFKRACFNLGIGIELYDYPLISIKLKTSDEMKASKPEYGEWFIDGQKPKQGWGLKLKDWVWYSEFTDGSITFLAASDGKETRFKWGLMKKQTEAAA
tara:strand:- start:41 stop:625 length:585 start_codon:yes stop_codon:yes gene_type:complete